MRRLHGTASTSLAARTMLEECRTVIGGYQKEHRIAYFQKDAFGALTFQEPCIQWRQKHIMTGKLLLSHNFCNRPLMRFIRFASNIGPAAAVPAGPALAPLAL